MTNNIPLFRLCTHAILLLRADKPESTQLRQQMVQGSHLSLLAQLTSQQTGDSVITALSSVLEGTITGLKRSVVNAGYGPVFEELIRQIMVSFNSSGSHDQEKAYLEQAPTKQVIVLEDALRHFTTSSIFWKPEMLQPFLASLPAQTSLSVYGVGPSWLYAALAAYQDPQSFYLFDPKIGWIQPARVHLGTQQCAEIHIQQEIQSDQHFTVLRIIFPHDRIDYFQPDSLAFPPISTEQGLVIDGRVPNWLLTALVRLYKGAGVPWIAPFYVPLNKAVIACSRVEKYQPGNLISVLR